MDWHQSIHRIYVLLYIFHPPIVTAILIFASYICWRKFKKNVNFRKFIKYIGVIFLMYIVVDTGFSLVRLNYARSLDREITIHQTINHPKAVVIAGNRSTCGEECRTRLLDGRLEEVFLLRPDRDHPDKTESRRVVLRESEACKDMANRPDLKSWVRNIAKSNECLIHSTADVPKDGIFVVNELRLYTGAAQELRSVYLMNQPPGRVVRFRGTEVQERRGGSIRILASSYSYLAPGFSIPLLVGCWERPVNIVWILPPGETGCGLWRLHISGGEKWFRSRSDPKKHNIWHRAFSRL